MTRHVQGSVTVEFALGLLIFLTFLLSATDLGRMLFTWNAAAEATRAGARYAVVCDDTTKQALVLSHMRALLPQISTVTVTWSPSGCTPATCEGVTVAVTGLDYQWISPVAGIAARAGVAMPGFSTYLPRERMRQDPNSAAACS